MRTSKSTHKSACKSHENTKLKRSGHMYNENKPKHCGETHLGFTYECCERGQYLKLKELTVDIR